MRLGCDVETRLGRWGWVKTDSGTKMVGGREVGEVAGGRQWCDRMEAGGPINNPTTDLDNPERGKHSSILSIVRSVTQINLFVGWYIGSGGDHRWKGASADRAFASRRMITVA